MSARGAPRRLRPGGARLRPARRPSRVPRAGAPSALRRRGAPVRPARRKRWELLALLLLLWGLVWMAWPSAPEPEPPPAPVAEAPPPPPAVPPPVKKKVAVRPPAPAPAPAPAVSSQRALLRRAMQARAPDLRACPLPPGAPTTLDARIRVARGGATRSVVFASGQHLPQPLSECLRQRLLRWEFSDVGLGSDVEIFVDFALGG